MTFANCAAFMSAVLEKCPTTGDWDYIRLWSTTMDASHLNPLLHCIATSDKVASTGFVAYDLDELFTNDSEGLDEVVIAALADKAPAATDYYFWLDGGTSKALQSSFVDLGTRLVQGGAMQYFELAYMVNLDAQET